MSNRLLNLAFNCREFRGTARLVLLSIADRINDETGICWSSYDDLQRRCHCSRGALAEALTELRESKVLKPQRRRNRSTLYSLDSELLESLAYPVSSESELHESSESEPAQFGNRTPGSSDSGVSKFGFPNANHPEPPSEPPVNRTTTTAAVSVVDSSVSYKTGNPEEQHQPQNQQPQPRRASPSDPPTETSRLETLRGLRPAKAGEVPSGAILPVDVSVNKTTGKFKIKHEHSSDCSKGCGLRWDPFETVESAVAELEARSAPAKAFAAENDEAMLDYLEGIEDEDEPAKQTPPAKAVRVSPPSKPKSVPHPSHSLEPNSWGGQRCAACCLSSGGTLIEQPCREAVGASA